MSERQSQAAAARNSLTRPVLTALAASSIEWYDFFLYGTAAALVFPTLFFAGSLPPTVALMASFATFAVGFGARPVGAVIFGHIGDRVGRKVALVIALLLMGAATTLIGCLPSYATAGARAPVLLVVLRFMQGLAIGGQWGGAMLLVTENAPADKRGFYGSFAQAGVPIGVVLANLAFLLASGSMTPAAFLSWGWRIPFLASIALVGLAVFVQINLDDTKAFLDQKASTASKSPVIEALRRYPKEIALAAGAFVATNTTFYILITFVVAYGNSPAGLNIPRTTMLGAVLIASGVMAPALLISGAWSDRVGRRRVYRIGCVLVCAWAFALFPLIETRSFLWITFAIMVGHAGNAMMYGPQAALFTELFTTRVRYSGASLGYQIGAIFGGALAPIIATSLIATFHSSFWISIYIAAVCTVSFVCVTLLPETRHVDLHERRGQ